MIKILTHWFWRIWILCWVFLCYSSSVPLWYIEYH